MGCVTAVALLLAQLIAISLACISSSSGRPGGLDLSGNTEIYPDYNQPHGVVGLSLEHRPSPNVDINVRPGVALSDALNGRFRPQGDVELQYRPNGHGDARLDAGVGVGPNGHPRVNAGLNVKHDITNWNVGARVGPNGDPRVNAGLEIRPNADTTFDVGVGVGPNGDHSVKAGFKFRFGRSIENETVHNIDISRKLFEVLDLNGDDQLDVKEWFDDGGKVRPFSDMIGDHDNNSDEMISLEEFLAIPVDPALIVAIDQLLRGDQN